MYQKDPAFSSKCALGDTCEGGRGTNGSLGPCFWGPYRGFDHIGRVYPKRVLNGGTILDNLGGAKKGVMSVSKNIGRY